ncbi:MAG: hypothetical protein NC347_13995 [Clostridium sp.]|nr:hypothetical protein [Clostridium sp.]
MNSKKKSNVLCISKKIFVLLVCCLVLCSSISAQAKPSAAKVKKVYKSYAKKHFTEKKYPYNRYKLYDINKDGTKEMIMVYSYGVRNGYQIYTYKKGKVVKLHKGTYGGAGDIYRLKGTKKIVIMFSGGASDTSYTCYYMKGTKLKKGDTYRSWYEYGTNEKRCEKNGKKISSKKMDAFTNKLSWIKMYK